MIFVYAYRNRADGCTILAGDGGGCGQSLVLGISRHGGWMV